MDDLIGTVIGGIFALMAIAFVVYIIVMVVGAALSVVSAGGFIWGGGTALINYISSFKENIIDSNLARA